jgi:hydroxyacylglutathione hydrolase
MSLDVTQLVLGPYQSNCYVVRRAGAADAIVVDPGWAGEGPRIQAALDGARCAAILVTHGDIDHVGAVAELADATGAPVYVPAGETADVGRAPDILLAGDEVLELAELRVETVRVPGHTPGHVAFFTDDSLFSGDVLFSGSVGRTDRPGGDWATLAASIRALLERYPPETLVYPGHGPETTLGREHETNPFLAELRAPYP